MSLTPLSPAADAQLKQAMRTMAVNVQAAVDELVRATPAMVAAALNGGELTCLSCGARTNQRGVLPCGH